jgi:hypothetical protein
VNARSYRSHTPWPVGEPQDRVPLLEAMVLSWYSDVGAEPSGEPGDDLAEVTVPDEVRERGLRWRSSACLS